MKKYDFILLGLYAGLGLGILLSIVSMQVKVRNERKEAKVHMEELYRHKIKHVILQDTIQRISIIKGHVPYNVEHGFVFSGFLPVKMALSLRVSGDTLYIPARTADVNLFLDDSIQVDILSNPEVRHYEFQRE